MQTVQPFPSPSLLRWRPVVEPLDPNTRKGLERFLSGLRAAQAILGPRAPVRLVQTLIDVAAHPDTTRAEVAERVDMPATTASQDLRTLGVELRDGSPGPRFVKARWDDVDGRMLRYKTTPQGQAALTKLEAAL